MKGIIPCGHASKSIGARNRSIITSKTLSYSIALQHYRKEHSLSLFLCLSLSLSLSLNVCSSTSSLCCWFLMWCPNSVNIVQKIEYSPLPYCTVEPNCSLDSKWWDAWGCLYNSAKVLMCFGLFFTWKRRFSWGDIKHSLLKTASIDQIFSETLFHRCHVKDKLVFSVEKLASCSALPLHIKPSPCPTQTKNNNHKNSDLLCRAWAVESADSLSTKCASIFYNLSLNWLIINVTFADWYVKP